LPCPQRLKTPVNSLLGGNVFYRRFRPFLTTQHGKNRYAFGIGGYDSRFLGILGRTLRKPFTLDEFSQERTVDADVDFRYLSVFGEYYLIRQEKIIIALNTQLGAGNIRVAYDLDGEPVVRKLRKGLVEHYAKLPKTRFPQLAGFPRSACWLGDKLGAGPEFRSSSGRMRAGAGFR